jgi:hypothetical protein
VDIDYKFGGATLSEDPATQQLQRVNKITASMADGICLSLPASFHPEITHSCDTLSIEDLRTSTTA